MVRRSSSRWLRRLVLLVAVLVVLFGGCRLATLALVQQAESRYPPAGQFVTVNGARAHYLQAGAGQDVVFLHGNGGQLQDFPSSLLDQVAAQYRILALDRPGHGYSERPPGTSTLMGQAQWLNEVLTALNVERPVLVGWSWGGALALAYAEAYPDQTAALVLLGAVAYPKVNFTPQYDLYNSMARLPVIGDLLVNTVYVPVGYLAASSVLEATFAPEPVDHNYANLFIALSSRPDAIRATVEDEDRATLVPALAALSAQYPTLNVPVVIVTGDSDANVVPEDHAYPLHKALPQSCLVVLPKSGHAIVVTQPSAVVEAIHRAFDAAQNLPLRCP
jgi:pimeloyl-ACP methyl ester carboxylesterase